MNALSAAPFPEDRSSGSMQIQQQVFFPAGTTQVLSSMDSSSTHVQLATR